MSKNPGAVDLADYTISGMLLISSVSVSIEYSIKLACVCIMMLLISHRFRGRNKIELNLNWFRMWFMLLPSDAPKIISDQ